MDLTAYGTLCFDVSKESIDRYKEEMYSYNVNTLLHEPAPVVHQSAVQLVRVKCNFDYLLRGYVMHGKEGSGQKMGVQ